MMRGASFAKEGAPQHRPLSVLDGIDPEATAWARVGPQVIFLDVAADRYFCLADDANNGLIMEMKAGRVASWHQPSFLPRPSDWQEPERTCAAIEAGRFSLSEVARALWLQRRVERRLAEKPLLEVLGELHAALGKRSGKATSVEESGRACIRAFEHARLIRTAADRCLPRSIALALALAARACHLQFFVGVKTAPFAAHCWVQHADEVLNDSVEEVRRYHPILIL